MTVQSFTAYIHPPCAHANGRYCTISIKWWLFTFSSEYFICQDCCEVIPVEDLPPDVLIPLDITDWTPFYEEVKEPPGTFSDMEDHREISKPADPSLTPHNSPLT